MLTTTDKNAKIWNIWISQNWKVWADKIERRKFQSYQKWGIYALGAHIRLLQGWQFHLMPSNYIAMESAFGMTIDCGDDWIDFLALSIGGLVFDFEAVEKETAGLVWVLNKPAPRTYDATLKTNITGLSFSHTSQFPALALWGAWLDYKQLGKRYPYLFHI